MAHGRDPNHLSQRLGDLAAHLEAKLRVIQTDKTTRKGARIAGTVLSNLGDLFTRGVTHEGLEDMVRREVRDTALFFTSQIDFDALKPLPWFKRYPILAWKIFTAIAFRLSPPRRIAFCIAVITFLIGLIELLQSISRPEMAGSGVFWWLISTGIFVLLLLMELRDKLDLKSDLEIAREIQIGLVPSLPFRKGVIDIRSHMRPANTVGGDYHDIIDLGENLTGILIGDVAGKGIPAALLMALLQGSLRTLLTAGFRGPDLMSKLNGYLCDNIPSNRLVTLFYGELSTDTGVFRYVNAGHNAPYLLRQGQAPERLEATSLVLGVLRDTAFDARECRLNPGDRLFLFTDGVTEAFDPKEEEYGEERLTNFLQRHPGADQDQLIADLIQDVLTFCGSSRPGDDMTLMVVKHL